MSQAERQESEPGSEPAPVEKVSSDPPPIQKVRTEEPQAPFGQDEPNPDVVSDATAADQGAESVDPGVGGYGERDPKSDMPRIPSAPETQQDPQPHGGEPPPDREPPASTNRV